jgi:uncharacterized protein
MRSRELAGGNAFVLVLDTGDAVVETLTQFARGNSVTAAFFFGIGAFEDVTIAFFNLAKKEYEHIPINEQVEVTSLIGNMSIYNGEPKIHAHVVVGKRDGSAHSGHLIEGIVRPTLEVYLRTSAGELRRRLDPVTDLPLLDIEN